MRGPCNVVFTVAFLGACEPVQLHLDPRVTAPPSSPATTEPPPVDPACPQGCAGGRLCRRGACEPHWLPITSPEVGATAPRVGHYVVWTGAEVIVWGGHDPRTSEARVYGDGLRFDPARGEVKGLSRLAAPTPRYDDGSGAAVWTGSEMIIWGGRGGDGARTDGAAYVPAFDRWIRVSGDAAPRQSVATVYTGRDLVLVPVASPDDALRASTDLSMFTRVGAMGGTAQQRLHHSALWTGSELVVWGGVDEQGRARSDGWRFSPRRRRTRMVASATVAPRSEHAAVWADGEMLVFGGRDASQRPIGELVSYVPATDAWRELNASGGPSPRYGHVAVWTGRSLLVWGGTDGVRVFEDGAEYDPWDNTWTRLEPLEAPPRTVAAREGAVGVWTGNELVVVGGWDHGDRVEPLGWRYQP